jgi:hypothetical protein
MIHSIESILPHPTLSVPAWPRLSHFGGGPENGVHFKVTHDPFFAIHTLCYMMELMKASMEDAKVYA